MSEVKGNSNSSNSTGLLHPANIGTTSATRGSEKPLEVNATALHPLPSKQQPTPEKTKIQFNSAVGSKNSQKIDPFAEQNAKRAEKEKVKAKKRKKIIIISSIIGGLLLLGIIAWIVTMILQPEPEPLPVSPVTIVNGSTEEIAEIQNQAQQIYNDNTNINPLDPNADDIKTVDQLFTEIIASPSGQEYPDRVRLAQFMFYVENNYYEQARKIIDEIDPSRLTREQRALYYNYAGTVYSKYEEVEKASEAYKEATNIRFELGGYGG